MFKCLPWPMSLTIMSALERIQSWRSFEDTQKTWLRSLGWSTWGHPPMKTPRGCWDWLKNEDDLGCLDQLIACTGHERIIPWDEKVSTRTTTKIQQSFLRLLHQRIYVFGLQYLDCLALIMTWICCRDHHSLLGLFPEILLLATMLSMALITRWVTTLQMSSIVHGPHLSRQPRVLKVTRGLTLSMRQESTRKDVERVFGVVQKRFGIIQCHVEYWNPQGLVANNEMLHHFAQHDHWRWMSHARELLVHLQWGSYWAGARSKHREIPHAT